MIRGGDAPVSTSPSNAIDGVNSSKTSNSGNSSSDDEVVVGEDDELCDITTSGNDSSMSDSNVDTAVDKNSIQGGNRSSQDENTSAEQSNTSTNLPNPVVPIATPVSSTSSGSSLDSSRDSSTKSCSNHKAVAVPSLFEEDVEFVGVELEGTEKAMEQALKEGIVGEAAPLKKNIAPKMPEKEDSDDGGAGMKEFNDANYWRVDQEVTVLE